MDSSPNSLLVNLNDYHTNNSFSNIINQNYISYLNTINLPRNYSNDFSHNNIYSTCIVYTIKNISINKFLNILDNLRYDGHIFIPFEILNYFFLNKDTIYPLYIKLYDDISITYFKEFDLIFSNNIDNLCYDAAKIGCLNLLRIAYRNGYHWDAKTCEVAASNGHLDCLKYAYENECPWSYNTYIEAEKNGHFDCLQYARDNGCFRD